MRLSLLTLLPVVMACSSTPYTGDYGVPYEAGKDGSTTPQATVPTVIASGLTSPCGIQVIANTIFVADSALGEIVSVPSSGGAATPIATGVGAPSWLATDGSQLFVTDSAGGRVVAVTTSGQTTVLATGQNNPGRIQVSNGVVYWLNQGMTDGAGALVSIATTGGVPTVIVSGLHTPHDLAVGAQAIYYTELGPSPNCALNEWSGVNDVASVALGPSDAGAAVVFTSNIGEVGRVTGLGLDPSGANLFVTTQDICWPKGGMVYDVSLSGDAGVALSQAPPSSDRVAADQTTITWASQNLISQVARDGGIYQNIASETTVADFVIVAGQVFWTNPVTGQILAQAVSSSSK